MISAIITDMNFSKEVINFLDTQRVGVLAVEMLDGSPHAATVHFAYTISEGVTKAIFYFETYKEYRKAELLLQRGAARASFVVGCDESNMKTFQVDGTIQFLKPEEITVFETVYLEKFPEKKEKSKDPKFVCFSLVPTWWRFTDWTTPDGKTIFESDKM